MGEIKENNTVISNRMLNPRWEIHPDRLRPEISIPEVGSVLFFIVTRVGLADFNLSSFVDTPP